MIRLLLDPPLDGPTNMARDEALLNLVGQGVSPPTLRLYRWDPPTISLGYFQRFAEYASLPPPAGVLAVVRRPTGGGAILHDLELTYSIALPIGHRLLAGGPNELYELAHKAVIASLAMLGVTAGRCGADCEPRAEYNPPRGGARAAPVVHSQPPASAPPADAALTGSSAARGPFFCFERRHRFDVLLGPDKIVGSAQRRTRHAVLQHGSIILGNRFGQQTTAAVPIPFDEAVSFVQREFAKQISSVTSEPLEPSQWSTQELTLAADLHAKHAGAEWVQRV